jgi:hypothetical protein
MGLLPALLLFYYNRAKESINTGSSSSKFMTFVICDLMRQSFCFAFYWSQDWSRSFFVEKEKKISSNKKEERRSAKHQCGDKTPQEIVPKHAQFFEQK